MIYTCTPNPAVDLNEDCGQVMPNSVVRTTNAVFTPNGKGLNVSFSLRHFGVNSKILGFFAGFTGQYIVNETQKRGFEVLPVYIEGITRVNLFLTSKNKEYKFVNSGAPITAQAEKEMVDIISSAEDLDCLVISGSLPPHTSQTFLNQIIDVVKAQKKEFVLDISSKNLRQLIRRGPLLIKPNDDELREIFNLDVKDDKSAWSVMKTLRSLGAKNILLTMGARGAYFFNGHELWFARPEFKAKLVSSACAGDATLGSFLGIWYSQKRPIEEALRTCQAVGANVVECPGLGDFSQVNRYQQNVEVRKVVLHA